MNPLLHRVTVDPHICHGKPCIRGMRYPVEFVFELIQSGMTFDEILEDYPELEPDDLKAVLLCFCSSVNVEVDPSRIGDVPFTPEG